ncbi:hypothetical protein ABVT39_003611 [Epinephelus coioides]
METHMGQFVIIDQGPWPTEGAEPYEDMSGPQGKVPKDQDQIIGRYVRNQYEIMPRGIAVEAVQYEQKYRQAEGEYEETVRGQPSHTDLHPQQRRPDGSTWTLHPDDAVAALHSTPAIYSATNPTSHQFPATYCKRSRTRSKPPVRAGPTKKRPTQSPATLIQMAESSRVPVKKEDGGDVNPGLQCSQYLMKAALKVQTTTTAQAPPQQRNLKGSNHTKLLPLHSPDPLSSSEDDIGPLSSYSPTSPPPIVPISEANLESHNEGHLSVQALSQETCPFRRLVRSYPIILRKRLRRVRFGSYIIRKAENKRLQREHMRLTEQETLNLRNQVLELTQARDALQQQLVGYQALQQEVGMLRDQVTSYRRLRMVGTSAYVSDGQQLDSNTG